MSAGMLEHVNVTVSDPDKTAQLMCDLFDWHIRWEGPSMMGGRTVHVGTDEAYVAVYTTKDPVPAHGDNHAAGGLNHIGVQVDDLAAVEQKVIAAGYKPFSHGDYEPGRRFYFLDEDRIEFEIVSYA